MKRCSYCQGELKEETTSFLYEDNNQVWVIRNVPTFVCQQCGEKEYSQETTHRILTLLKKPPKPIEILNVPAYDLALS